MLLVINVGEYTYPWVGSSSRGTSTFVEVAAGRSAAGESYRQRSEMVFRSKMTCQLVVGRSFPRSHSPKYQ